MRSQGEDNSRPGPDQDDPNAPMTVVVGIVGCILVFVIIVALQALFHEAKDAEFRRKVINQKPEQLRSLRSEQLEQLNSYRWVDQQAGVVAIPIDRAMELMVQEARSETSPRAQGSKP